MVKAAAPARRQPTSPKTVLLLPCVLQKLLHRRRKVNWHRDKDKGKRDRLVLLLARRARRLAGGPAWRRWNREPGRRRWQREHRAARPVMPGKPPSAPGSVYEALA